MENLPYPFLKREASTLLVFQNQIEIILNFCSTYLVPVISTHSVFRPDPVRVSRGDVKAHDMKPFLLPLDGPDETIPH